MSTRILELMSIYKTSTRDDVWMPCMCYHYPLCPGHQSCVTKHPWLTNLPPIRPAHPEAPQVPEVTGGPLEVIQPLIREREPGPPLPMAEVIPGPAPQLWEVTAPRPPGPEVTGQLRRAQAAATTQPRPPLGEAAMTEVTAAEAAQEEVMEGLGAEVAMEEGVGEEVEATAAVETAIAVMGAAEDEEAMVEVAAVAMEGVGEEVEVALVVAEMRRSSQTTRSSSRASLLMPPQRTLHSSSAPSV